MTRPTPRFAGLLLGPLAALLATTPTAAQDDLRDVVRTADQEIRGRVLTPFADPTQGDGDEVLIVQGGKRVRVQRGKVTAMDLVDDRTAEFVARRRRLPDSPAMAWILVEWARSRELPELARLQAFDLVLRHDDHDRAHEFLGHRRHSKGWLWELDGRWLTREQFLAQWGGRRHELRSEHWRLQADAGFPQAVGALLDLEALYADWFSRFGEALRLQPALAPMAIEVSRDLGSFAKWGMRPLPFHVPDPHGDVGRTFYGADPERPRLLFFLGTQAILYHCLAGNPSLRDDRDRVCPWLEIGLGMWAESRFQGPAGRAAPGDPRYQDLQAMAALGRSYRLTHLLHLPMYGGYYLMDDTPTAVNWSAAQMLVAFLLRPDQKPDLRGPFLEYVRQAFAERKGDSSTAFDKTLGRRIEDIEPELQVWLNKLAGF